MGEIHAQDLPAHLQADVVVGSGGNVYLACPRGFFTRRVSCLRQRSKLFWNSRYPPIQQPHSFTRARHIDTDPCCYANRQRSRRFRPLNSRPCPLSAVTSCAELVSVPSDPLLPVEYVARSEPASIEMVVLVNQSPSLVTSVASSSGLPCGPCLSDGEPVLLTDACVAPESVPPTSSLSPLALVFVPNPHHPFLLPFEDIFPPRSIPLLHPNTDTCINGLPARSSCPTRVASNLNRDAWAYFLRDYLDRSFIDSLLYRYCSRSHIE
ncbi:hypothetical protein J3R30DRAFT_668928 [Lentinula aciculospora]|uniref:Uncharacterized protein n=1 Tax=Lentinula aciculospora TaxID=153920 RepID=A0A9W9A4K0_9AGAR|nr:hypothetical protein J3R30DRAFT_668928 [Lentinula aciculospora]